MCSIPDHPNLCSRTITGERDSFDFVEDAIVSAMKECNYPENAIFSVRVAIEEALANAVLHGHRGDRTKEIEVTWCVTDDSVEFTVADQGRGYNPNTIPDPTADENLTIPSGRGLAMISAFMDEVELNSCGNKVRMKHLNSSNK